MNRLTAPRTDTRVADEQQGLPLEPLKADQSQQQRFEQAFAQQRARDNKALLDKPSKQDENRRAAPAVPFTSSKVVDKERVLVDRGLARPAPRSKALNDKLGVNDDLQESRQLPTTSSQMPEGILVSTAQQGRETTRADQAKLLLPVEISNAGFTKQPLDEQNLASSTLADSHKLPVAAEPDARDSVNKYASDLPVAEVSNAGFTKQPLDEQNLACSTLADSHKLPVAAEPDARDSLNKYASDLPVAEVSNAGFTKQPLDEQNLASSTLADSHKQQEQSVLPARLKVDDRQQTVNEPTEQLPVTSEDILLAQESFAGLAIRVPPLTATPGDLLLARVAPCVDHHDLGQLLSRLAVDIHLELGRPERPPILQLTLPAFGELTIRIEHHQGTLQVEMLASEQGSQLLNQGRGELIDRLQRLYPGERVVFDLFTQDDSEQGSRQKRSIYDEWDTDA